ALERSAPAVAAGGTGRPAGNGGGGGGPVPVAAGPTAAGRYKWGRPIASEDFRGRSLNPRDWEVYSGRSGDGRRDPRQVKVANGALQITGKPDGTTGGVAWMRGAQKRGRWEARILLNRACACYNANLLLWPVHGGGGSDPKGGGGEIDYMETYGDNGLRKSTNFFLHYGPEKKPKTLNARVNVDLTKWHAFAVEWNGSGITGYVDGRRTFHTTKRAAMPPGAMGQAIQLDFFRSLTRKTAKGVDLGTNATLFVDWIRMYRP
ncbi:glycoside hydrolase family 16 protein, partial [Actinomadura roseirufa]|uniref:glycoside hydrolase family 16 protein n=1 Tax=Actinomadura roseirufa TaxID=2094049 RepID=UPI0010416721